MPDLEDALEAYENNGYKTAFKIFMPLAEHGDAEAQCCLGNMYSNGEYVAQDEEEAAKWLRLAAEQGDTDAQSMFGLMCANGEGVVKNDEEAVEWLLLAAEKGNSCAQSSLGLIFGEGLGVIQDSVQAHKWFKVSTMNGDEEEILLAIQYMDALEGEMAPDEIEEAKKLANEWMQEHGKE